MEWGQNVSDNRQWLGQSPRREAGRPVSTGWGAGGNGEGIWKEGRSVESLERESCRAYGHGKFGFCSRYKEKFFVKL